MSKKSIIILLIIGLVLILGFIVFYILNARGYIKIFGDTNLSNITVTYQAWYSNNGVDNVDFSSGGLKLKLNTLSERIEDKITTKSLYNSRGAQGMNYDQVLDNKTVYFDQDIYRVVISGLDMDDAGTIEVNGTKVVDMFQYPGWCWGMNQPTNTRILRKCMGQFGGCESQSNYFGQIEITSNLHLPGSNTFKLNSKDWCGGNVGYNIQLSEYKKVKVPASTSYSNSGYIISKIISNPNINNFSYITTFGETKPANTDITFQFVFSNDVNLNTASANWTSTYHSSSDGYINLNSITGGAKYKSMAIKVNLTSSDGVSTPTLGLMNINYSVYNIPSVQIPTISLSASPTTVTAGGKSTLSWVAQDATSLSINNGIGSVGNSSGSREVVPTATTTYTITATGLGGSSTAQATIKVNPVVLNTPTVSLVADPAVITEGDKTRLTWNSTDTTSLVIDNGIGSVTTPSDSRDISPIITTTYIITATGLGGTKTAQVTITVNPKIVKLKVTNEYQLQSKSKTQPKKVNIKVVDNSNVLITNLADQNLDDNLKFAFNLSDNVSGNLIFYSKVPKHLSKKIAKNFTEDSSLIFEKMLAGDLNNDDTVNSLDWSLMNKYWQQTSDDNDLTGDGIINTLDWSIMNANWGKKGDGLTDNINFN